MTQQNLDDATTEKEAAAAAVAATQAQVEAALKNVSHAETRLSKTILKSPLDGVVALRNVNVGDLVGEAGAQKVLFRIVNNRRLDLTVTVPSRAMERVAVGQPVVFFTDAFLNQTFKGTVSFVNPAVNQADRSLKVIIEVPNDSERLKGGLFVKGRIITGNRKNVLQVPRAALLNWNLDQNTARVLTVKGDVARIHPIQTGTSLGDQVEIVSGLRIGDQVITRGGFNLRDGDKVKVILPKQGT
jgi:RND family efflux transporter MFP subunit